MIIKTLSREAVRERLSLALPEPVTSGDRGRSAAGAELVEAAVLVGIIGHPARPTVLLTRRTAHLRDHAGQISFPGGRLEPEDQGHEEAALREAEEEVGLDRRQCHILGVLPAYVTITGFRVTPIVGWIEPPIQLKPDPFEVDEVFEVPLAFVLDRKNHRRDSYIRDAEERWFYVLDFEDRYIWGATAGMLVNFAHALQPQS
ncbi:MAG: CoA pyrophosphatase [Geminicoccaceae bacterium]